MENYQKSIVIIAKIVLYTTIILFVSLYFKLSIHDENFEILLSKLPFSIFVSILVVFFEYKFNSKNAK